MADCHEEKRIPFINPYSHNFLSPDDNFHIAIHRQMSNGSRKWILTGRADTDWPTASSDGVPADPTATVTLPRSLPAATRHSRATLGTPEQAHRGGPPDRGRAETASLRGLGQSLLLSAARPSGGFWGRAS